MRSSFSGLEIARSGMHVAQRQLDVTGHNLSNADTVGYSRQRFATAAVDPFGSATRLPPVEKGRIGLGVQTLSLDQIRDIFLDRQYRQENSKYMYWSSRAQSLYYLEDLFNTFGDNGLDSLIGGFLHSFHEMDKNPTDLTIRRNVTNAATEVMQTLRYYYEQMRDMTMRMDEQVGVLNSRVNTLLRNIQEMNDRIFNFELTGNTANDLRDKRNLLLDELSGLVEITYVEENEPWTGVRQMSVWIGSGSGKVLMVEHNKLINSLTALKTGTNSFWEMVREEDANLIPPPATPLPLLNEIYYALNDRTLLNYTAPREGDVFLRENEDGEETWFRFVNGAWHEHGDTENPALAPYNPADPDNPSNAPLFVDGMTAVFRALDVSPSGKNGQIQALFDLRDGDVVHTQGIPYFSEQLNELARHIVEEINRVHRTGWTMPHTIDGVEYRSATNINFFHQEPPMITDAAGVRYFAVRNTDAAGNLIPGYPLPASLIEDTPDNRAAYASRIIYDANAEIANPSGVAGDPNVRIMDVGGYVETTTGVQIWNMMLSSDVLRSGFNIANSNEEVLMEKGDAYTGNNLVAEAIAKLKDATNLGTIGGFSTFSKTFQGELGVEAAYTNSMAEQGAVLMLNIEYQRQSVMGVNIDEELTNMIKFQHTYNAAARMITAMDQNLDVLINRTGRVGL